MTQALGQLPNAPLIYVLAHIKFTRTPKMRDIWEDFHQRVFDVYPESEVEQVAQFEIKREGLEPSKETRWNLLSRNRRKGLILRSNALILHTTSYTTSKDFFIDLEFALNNLIELLPPSVQIKRLGLRYVDILLPINNIEVDQQINNKLGTVNLEQLNCSPVKHESTARYTTPMEGELVFRHRQTTSTDVLPGDLFPNSLEPAPLLSIERQEKWIVGSLDFDHFLKIEMPLDTQNVIEIFRELQVTTSAAFRKVTTAEVMNIWKKIPNA